MPKTLISYFLFLFFIIAFFSCGDRPSDVLREKEMVNLMVDMELAEAYLNTQNTLSGRDREEIGKRVIASHGVSEETLDTTLAWYGRNMDEYSELFEKVDKEIEKRKKKYIEPEGLVKNETDNLWQYNSHLVLSPLSGKDAFSFSIPYPDIEKGDIINLSLFLPNSASVKTTLGVEYNDGYGEAVVSNISKNRMQLELQTDSGKIVNRIFGTMHVKEEKSLPLFIDSISIKGMPIDTLNYRSKRRSQKNFGPNNL